MIIPSYLLIQQWLAEEPQIDVTEWSVTAQCKKIPADSGDEYSRDLVSLLACYNIHMEGTLALPLVYLSYNCCRDVALPSGLGGEEERLFSEALNHLIQAESNESG